MSGFFRLDIPPHVAEVVRGLPPEVSHAVKAALRLLGRDPHAGTPLRRQLDGYWRYRVRRFRIVYQRDRRTVRVVAIGHRQTVYEDFVERLAERKR